MIAELDVGQTRAVLKLPMAKVEAYNPTEIELVGRRLE
jgi:hypothetical protein